MISSVRSWTVCPGFKPRTSKSFLMIESTFGLEAGRLEFWSDDSAGSLRVFALPTASPAAVVLGMAGVGAGVGDFGRIV